MYRPTPRGTPPKRQLIPSPFNTDNSAILRLVSDLQNRIAQLEKEKQYSSAENIKEELTKKILTDFYSHIKVNDPEDILVKKVLGMIKQPKDGKDGLSPQVDYQKIAEMTSELVLNSIEIPQPKNGEDGKSVDADELVEKVFEQIYSGKKKIKIDNVDGISNLRKTVSDFVARHGGMRGGEGLWKIKNLSGTMDGNNTIFTVSGDKPATNSHRVMLNYLEQNPLGDYTLTYSSGVITVIYAVAPDSSLSGLPHYIRYM